jgi:LysR family glycine cleavage system transcriptional activator
VDGIGVALESERFAERELARGDLVEVGPTPYSSAIDREVHFLSLRSSERHVDKIKRFRERLLEQLQSSHAVAVDPPGPVSRKSRAVPHAKQ